MQFGGSFGETPKPDVCSPNESLCLRSFHCLILLQHVQRRLRLCKRVRVATFKQCQCGPLVVHLGQERCTPPVGEPGLGVGQRLSRPFVIVTVGEYLALEEQQSGGLRLSLFGQLIRPVQQRLCPSPCEPFQCRLLHQRRCLWIALGGQEVIHCLFHVIVPLKPLRGAQM